MAASGTAARVYRLTRPSRNQTSAFVHAYPSAVRAILDDPPIHIRPYFPASAGARQTNPVRSSHFGAPMIASSVLHRHEILLTTCRESVHKRLRFFADRLRKSGPCGATFVVR